MSLAISIDLEDSHREFTLRSHRPNDDGQLNLIFHGTKFMYEGTRHSEIYRGRLYDASAAKDGGREVVCKFAYGKRTIKYLEKEMQFYEGKLQHLQGVYIPICHGYFVGQSHEGRTACLVLDYCGEPIEDAFSELDPTFKTAILHAALAIHDAGVMTFDWAERNVLNYGGLPMVIDFDEAEPHKCERTMPVIEGKPAPRCTDFGCSEIWQLVEDLRLWKPNTIRFLGVYYPLELAYDPHKLAAKAPKHMSPEDAYKEARRTIIEHGKRYYPETVKAWRDKKSKENKQTSRQPTKQAAKDAKKKSAKRAAKVATKPRTPTPQP
ncbi:hypothetical protein EVG20_g4974 [Dentipellis fragilis]|uniref:Protein kinase domain-containing protein n=1 Tax=Dentipellis fragilis TaxID=205917 RepID=A0A4Y9YWL5_9AGAM|nr:hypothetical protein EVG20_g4974 [Dentipellis fragilis]